MTREQKAVTAVGVLVAAAGLSTFGIIDLVARGYGTLAWGFIALVGRAAVRGGAVAVGEGGWVVWPPAMGMILVP